MMVFDTNVGSELMKSSPDEAVWNWLLARRLDGMYTTAITVAEIHYGIERLPIGRRRTLLRQTADEAFAAFTDEILPFNAEAAVVYPVVVADRFRAGLPIDVFDAQIAAICRVAGATLATRNTKDFLETGIELVNPWD
jgi:predicted nucleic acid-binding protein